MEDQPDGSLVVRFTTGGLREMCWSLFTWGSAVEILAPDSLRRIYTEMLERVKVAVRGNVKTFSKGDAK